MDRIKRLNQEQSIIVATLSEMLIGEQLFGFRHFDTLDDFNQTTVLPLRYFIQGVAGVGKSYVFKIVSDMCEYRRCLGGLDNKIVPILKVAHQGIAAMNIDGITIMRAFKQRPFQTTEGYGENAKTTAELDELLPRIGTMEMDELGSVSSKQFVTLERITSESVDEFYRAKGVTQYNRQPWGGMHIILGGDFGQLKPVEGQSITDHLDLLQDFKAIRFTTIVRQSDPLFADCLKNFIEGKCTDNDRRMIKSRQSCEENWYSLGNNITALFHTNLQVENFNKRFLFQLNSNKKTHLFEALYRSTTYIKLIPNKYMSFQRKANNQVPSNPFQHGTFPVHC